MWLVNGAMAMLAIKDIRFVLAAVLGLNVLIPSAAMSATVGNCHITDVTTSTACLFFTGNNENQSSLFNPGPMFGVTNWVEVSHQLDATSANNFGPLSATGGGSTSGSWSVANFGGYSNALLVVKGADGFVSYLLNTLFTSGTWSTLGIFNGGQCASPPVLTNGCNHPGVSHLALYEGGTFTPPHGPPVVTPIPGAFWLFGTVVAGGVGFNRWRRKRKALTAVAA